MSDAGAYHHGSHRHLLTEIAATNIDAIIVPAAREPARLQPAVDLAAQLRCQVVAVCTYDATAKEAGALSDRIIGVDFSKASFALAPLSSDQLLARERRTFDKDTGARRNLGLLIGRSMGWQRVLFLDDDLDDLDPRDVQNAAARLGDFDVIGIQNYGYPDNSVLCHTRAQMNYEQTEFIGGGAIVVNPSTTNAFFPRVYCEDWLFFIGDALVRGDDRPLLGFTGATHQAPFDPYAIKGRAAEEEFGDLFAEGLFWLLDQHLPLAGAADPRHWDDVRARRAALFRHVLAELRHHMPEGERRVQVERELKLARRVSEQVTSTLCADYFDAWRHDLTTTWPQIVDALGPADTVEHALEQLYLAEHT